ncbi:MAG: Lrp/AsnC family transcriptional regulator [Granulosicoccus sp.]
MTQKYGNSGTDITLDEADRRILRLLQQDSTASLEQLAKKVGISRTAIWNRIQRLLQDKVILKQAAFVDAGRVGLNETFFIAIKTSQHDASWLEAFKQAIHDMPEIAEAHRLAGDMDYILKVQVASTGEYDEFYKRLIARVAISSVTSCLSMEMLKFETTVPV